VAGLCRQCSHGILMYENGIVVLLYYHTAPVVANGMDHSNLIYTFAVHLGGKYQI
jgi:hypothetical protein